MSDKTNGKPEGVPRSVAILAEDTPERVSAALAVRESEPLVLDIARSLPQAAAQFKAIREFMKSVMIEAVPATKDAPGTDGDYGTVPGIAKPFLFKSGAEKLATLFGYAPQYVTLDKTEDFNSVNGFFFYRYRCDLILKTTGSIMGSGIGSCNSKEDRYRWSQAQRVCPECGKATIIKGKKEFDRSGGEGGWVCWSRKEIACGAKWPDGAKVIESQAVERVEREAFSQVNTIDKMAQKRALVAATLIATGTSSLFTQDEETVEASDKATAAKPATVVSGGDSKPAAAAQTAAADGPFWRDATPIECRDIFQGPEDKDGRAGRNKKTKDLPKGCRYRVEDVKGEKNRQGEQKKSYTPEVDAMIYGGDSRSEPVQGPKADRGPIPITDDPKHPPEGWGGEEAEKVASSAPMGELNGDKLDREIALEIRKKGWSPARVTLKSHQLGAKDGEWTKADEPLKMRLLSALCDSEVVAAR